MAKKMRKFLDRLVDKCELDFLKRMAYNLLIVLRELEETIFDDPMDRDCRVNLSDRAEQRLKLGYEIVDIDDYDWVHELVEKMLVDRVRQRYENQRPLLDEDRRPSKTRQSGKACI